MTFNTLRVQNPSGSIPTCGRNGAANSRLTATPQKAPDPRRPSVVKEKLFHQDIAFLRTPTVGLDKAINAKRLHSSLDRKIWRIQ